MTEHRWRQRFSDGTMAQNEEYYLQGIVYCLGVKGSQRELKAITLAYKLSSLIPHLSSKFRSQRKLSFALLTEELKDVCFNPLSMGEGLG